MAVLTIKSPAIPPHRATPSTSPELSAAAQPIIGFTAQDGNTQRHSDYPELDLHSRDLTCGAGSPSLASMSENAKEHSPSQFIRAIVQATVQNNHLQRRPSPV